MTKPLAGRRALVTGGSSGIGRAIVERLAWEGVKVAFTGRNMERGFEVAVDAGAAFIPADASDRAACDHAMDQAVSFLEGRIDIMVNCAAVVYAGPVETTSPEAMRELVEVNLTAAFRYTRACLALMAEDGGGSIVHIVSDAAIRGIHKLPVYSMTKAGQLAMAELFAADGAPSKVRVNAICPGAVYPGMRTTLAGFEHHAEDPSGWATPASGRWGCGEDIASLVVWLASEEAEHISGATIRVDGAASVAMRDVALA